MITATRAFAAAMRPFSTGASYLNFTQEGDRVRDAYGDAKYARLAALKDTYDPANLFRLNPEHPAQLARCGTRTRLARVSNDHGSMIAFLLVKWHIEVGLGV